MNMNVRDREGVIVIKPSGRIIGPASIDLKTVVDDQLANVSEPPKLLFDLADVSMMDSAGLGTLMGIHVSVARKGGRIAVINVASGINNLIVMAKLIAIFERFASEDEAIVALTATGS